jgi:hypothetical protein
MATSGSTINREWIASELSKGIGAEHELAAAARARAESPPDPALSALYGEIASDDDRHARIVETVATRYGHAPTRGPGGGIGETLTRLKDAVAGSVRGPDPREKVAHDLVGKANAIHWYAAWVHAFQAIGDTESARELSAALTEETAHRDALQEGLNRLVEQGAQAASEAEAAKS